MPFDRRVRSPRSTPTSTPTPPSARGVVPRLVVGVVCALATIAVEARGLAQVPPGAVQFDTSILDRDLGAIRIDPEFATLVEQLGSESAAARSEAQAALLSRRVPVFELLAVLQRSDLDVEQRQRLLRVVDDQVRSIPRGALGIRMETAREAGEGVVISGFVTGMPAEDVLQIGDRIVVIEGQPTPTSVELISAVQSRLPGEVLRLEIVRRGDDGVERKQIVDLVIGSVEQLGQSPDDPFARSNPVLAQRAKFIAEIGRRYGPSRVEVELEPRTAAPAPPIESHPELLRLRRYLEIVDSGAVSDPTALEILWQRRLARLRQSAVDPRLGAAERAVMREVVERFEGMLRERG